VRISRPFTVIVLLLLVAFALPALCFAVPAGNICAGAGEMTGGSHGDHCPASQQRACCQMDHGTPMTVSVVRLVAQTAFGSAVISDSHEDLIYPVAHVVTANAFSPPPPRILRI
jgi:hypothetical protein